MPEDQPHNHNPASNPEFESLGEEQKQEWLRRKALTEILYTEQLYVQDLITLQQLFLEKSKDVLPAGYRREIFHSLEAVVGVAKMFLQELQSLPVHVAFMKVANFLKVYTAYCAGYNNSLLALTQSRKSSKEWDKYLKETENTQQTNFLSLSSYLIKPVQRICRYPLMLREIMKYTPQSHTDYGSFGEALAQIERITEQVNEGKRVSENMQRIVEIHNSFSDREKPDICNPSRILVREGALMKLSDGKLQTRHFFLFNDSLLYAKPTLLKKSEGLWVFCGQWSLDKIQILDISSPGSSAPPVASLRGSGELTRSPEIMRGSGGSEIIRSDRVLQRKAAEIFGGSVGMARTTDDTPSSSPSLYLSSPSSTASSTPSIVSSPSPPLSPNSPTFGSGQRGNLMINQRAAIPSIFLTPPPSPTFAPASAQRKHSNTESDASTHKAESAGLRIVIAAKRRSRELSDTEKDKEKSKEATGPGGSSSVRIDHKRSLTASAGDDKIPHEVSTRSATPPLDSEANKNSINLARTHSVEYQKLVASLPDNAQHCFIVYAPVMGKPKRYILCAPDQRTKMLWLNDLLTQWRKASMLSQSRAIRLVSQELGDQLESSMEMKVEVRSKEKEKEEKNVGREQKSKEESREEKEVMELLEVKIAAPKEVSNDGRSNETRRERQKEIKGGTGGTEASSEARKEREKELKGSTGIREATSELWREREKQQLKVSLEMIKEASISEMRRERDKEMKGSGGVTKEASISEVRRERDKEMKGSGGISKEASKTNEMEKSKVKQESQGKEVEIGRLDTRSRMENVPRPKRETGGDKKELEVRMEDLLVDKKIVEVVSRVYREIEESEFERAIRERLDKVNNEDRSPLPSDRSERELGRGGGGGGGAEGGAGGAGGGGGAAGGAGGGGKSDRREKLEGSTGTPRGDQSDKHRGGRERDKERDRERDKERNGENRGERTDRERRIEKERSDVRRGDNNERTEQRKEVEKRGRSNSSESAKTDRSDRSDRSEARRQLGKDSDRSGYKSDVSERSDRGERSDSERERSDRETSTERARAREKRDKERREARERRENKERREKQHVMYRDNSNSSEMRGGERGREKKEAKERHRDGELRDLTCEEENEELWAHIKFLEVCLRGEKEKGGKEKKERKEKGKEKGEGKHKETRKETEEKYGDEETNNTAGIEREKDTRLQNTAGKPKRSHSPAAKRG